MDQVYWHEHQNRPTSRQIRLNRQRVREVVLKERQQILRNHEGRRLCLELGEELDKQHREDLRCIEFEHYRELIKSDMSLDEYEDLQVHPHNQYPLETVQFIYHIWLKVKESASWRVDFAAAIPNYSMKQKMPQRIGTLPNSFRDLFDKVYKKGDDRGYPYTDDICGMLEFCKNAIFYSNHGAVGSTLTLSVVEECIRAIFPELSLYLYNYCLQKKISIKELIDIKKFEVDQIKACETSNCYYCATTPSAYERATNSDVKQRGMRGDMRGGMRGGGPRGTRRRR